MLISTIMMTVPKRLESCRLSLESARQAGLDPTVVLDVNHEGPYPTFARCLRAGLGTQADFVAVLQDDIRLSIGLESYLRRCLSRTSCGVWSLFTSDRVLSEYKQEFPAVVGSGVGWFRVRIPSRADGAQAYVFAHQTAWEMLHHLPHPERRSQVDHWVGVFCRDQKVPYWAHIPSLCSHQLPNDSTLDDAGVEWCRVASSFIPDVSCL